MLNNNVTSMIFAYRQTGDVHYLNEVDRLMQIVRGHLKDTNNDGFVNFIYKRTEGDSTIAQHIGKDTHVMEEQLMHSWLRGRCF